MNGDTLVQAINDFGFPVIAAAGLGYFVYYTWNWLDLIPKYKWFYRKKNKKRKKREKKIEKETGTLLILSSSNIY